MTRCKTWEEARDAILSPWTDRSDDIFAYACFLDCVLVGKVVAGRFVFHQAPDFTRLMEIHIFNANRETRAVWSDGENTFLCVNISKCEAAFEYREKFVVLGTSACPTEWIDGIPFTARSQNGNTVTAPFALSAGDVLRLEVVNYFSFNENELCLKDYRLTGFTTER